MNKSQPSLYCTERTCFLNLKRRMNLDLTVIFLTGLGAGALFLAFLEYRISWKKRMHTD
jgi:hypothetical protein